MSDTTRPPRPSFTAQGSAMGNRVVSQPSFPSPGAGRPGGHDEDVNRPDRLQERARAVSMTSATPHPTNGSSAQPGTVQGFAGQRQPSGQPDSGGSARYPQSGSSHSQQTNPASRNPNVGDPRHPNASVLSAKQQRDNVQLGSFAVAGRSPSSQEQSTPTSASLQAGQANRPANANAISLSQQLSQQSLPSAETTPGRTSVSSRNGNPALAQVLQSYIDLNTAQGSKLYASSPPELEMIFARQTNGAQPKYVLGRANEALRRPLLTTRCFAHRQGPPGSVDNDWDKIWLQLTGTSLCKRYTLWTTALADSSRGDSYLVHEGDCRGGQAGGAYSSYLPQYHW